MNKENYHIRSARPNEFNAIGKLMVEVYSQLSGFPNQQNQPAYYDALANVGRFTNNPQTELLVALNSNMQIVGAVVYIGDMQHYGSGGSASQERDAAGFRLLAVSPEARGQGLGKMLSLACINKAKTSGRQQLIIHTTESMQLAWKMYERLGFKRSTDLDFLQKELQVFGFRMKL